jgi:hypothetical protein
MRRLGYRSVLKRQQVPVPPVLVAVAMLAAYPPEMMAAFGPSWAPR